MDTYILTALGGIVAAVVMSVVMYFIHWRDFAEADMIRALGSMVMKKEEDALFAGVAIHLVSGVIFAFLYVGIWSFLPLEAMREFLLFGILSGTFHGLVVSFLLITLVAGRHPVERFRNAGIGVGVAHLIGHVAYGAAVGAFAGKFRLRLEFIADMAS